MALRLHLSEEVAAARAAGGAVVALESTVLAHGLPWPTNLEVALQMEQAVRTAGAVPATIAVMAGRPCVGLGAAELERVARGATPFLKAGVADLAALMARGGDGATTVSATALLAARAGIPLFATGGIGGVHRGDSGDVSSDLTVLGSALVAVVTAGAKAILDLPRTLEHLEMLGVPVVGYGCDELPAFYTPRSGLPLAHRVDTPAQAAALIHAHWSLWGSADPRSLVLANPIPAADALDPALVEPALAAALAAAKAERVSGKALTPFLLARMARETGQRSVAANRALLVHNARTAAEIAVALAAHPGWQELRPWRTSAC